VHLACGAINLLPGYEREAPIAKTIGENKRTQLDNEKKQTERSQGNFLQEKKKLEESALKTLKSKGEHILLRKENRNGCG